VVGVGRQDADIADTLQAATIVMATFWLPMGYKLWLYDS